MIKAAILGYGTVGSGVYDILRKNAQTIERKVGQAIDIKYILDIRDFEEHPEKHLFTKNFDDILNDDEVKLVAEVMGGLHPAYEFSKAALLAGKNVITSNKELVATHGTELLQIAEEQNVNYLFEASVGGGIPIIRPLNLCLAANEIEEIYGILNGTTNFILTKMFAEGTNFNNALAEAQRLGYAERNPAADVEGHDACRKIAILASLASGSFVDYNRIATVGITDISKSDVIFAEKIGCVIKLIGYAKIDRQQGEERVYACVCPMVISRESQLANVNDVFNAVLLHGNAVDDVMFYGRGAGKLPTASAVVADMIDAAKHVRTHIRLTWKQSERDIFMNPNEITARYMVRAQDFNLIKEFENAQYIGERNWDCAFVTEAMTEQELKERLNGRGKYIRMLA